jgi:hypothetical protein
MPTIVQEAEGAAGIVSPAAAAASGEASSAASNISSAAGNILPGLADIGHFADLLASGSLWIRIGEVALGLLLIAVGVAQLTHAIPAATRVARIAGAGAAA